MDNAAKKYAELRKRRARVETRLWHIRERLSLDLAETERDAALAAERLAEEELEMVNAAAREAKAEASLASIFLTVAKENLATGEYAAILEEAQERVRALKVEAAGNERNRS